MGIGGDLKELHESRARAAARRPMKIVILGHGRAGKDTACEYLAEITGLRNAGTCSKYLAKYVAAELGVPESEAYATRHENREEWFRIGNETRERDPALFVREMLAAGDIGGGIRSAEEFQAAKAEGLFDVAVWIENPRVPVDPTMKIDWRCCDLIARNAGTMDEFRTALDNLARLLGIHKHLGEFVKCDTQTHRQ